MAPGIQSESDGIEEALETTVRLAVMAGARLGSEIARAREDRLREQRRVDEREADRLAQRFEAEKRAAVAELSQVHRADWWERADPERIGQTYATARAWAPEAEEAAQAERKMREELHQRYGVDLDRINPRAVATEVEAWRQRLEQQRRQEADRERTAETAERAEAATLLDQAARDDRQADVAREDERADVDARQADGRDQNPWLNAGAQESPEEPRQRAQEAEQRSRDSEARSDQPTGEAERLYDSADRRAAEVRALEAKGIDPEVAQNRMHADTAAGKPATLATAGARRSRAPKARKGVGRGAQVERAGVER